jgi:NAD(P)-dependent dehydrogenase (short-subunit alcohol dehydrogenase family)
MPLLTGKTAIVTGASRGIGLAIARRFVEEGARVLIASRTAPPEDMQTDSCRWHKADISDPAQVEALFDQAVAQVGRVDVLVNNAGVQLEKTLAETSEEDWDWLMGVNLKGLFLCSRAAIRQMRHQGGGGVILNLGSVSGQIADYGLAAYCASKAGVHGLTRAIAVDHGPEGIRCNAICPGWIRTEMMDQAFAQSDDPADAERRALARHPLGRMGRPEDIAAMAVWLASDEASFVSGQFFTVDGALTAASPIKPTPD